MQESTEYAANTPWQSASLCMAF